MALIGNNSLIPGAPEFGKGWKKEHNAGCPCRCTIENPVTCTTTIQRFTRYDQSADLVSTDDCGCPAPIATSCDLPGEDACASL